MNIRVINGFYDADKRRIIEKSEFADYDDKRAKELIALGLAVKVTKKEIEETKKAAQEAEEAAKKAAEEQAEKEAEEAVKKAAEEKGGEIDENGNFLVDGKIIGHVEGEDIVITDPDVIKATVEDNK